MSDCSASVRNLSGCHCVIWPRATACLKGSCGSVVFLHAAELQDFLSRGRSFAALECRNFAVEFVILAIDFGVEGEVEALGRRTPHIKPFQQSRFIDFQQSRRRNGAAFRSRHLAALHALNADKFIALKQQAV